MEYFKDGDVGDITEFWKEKMQRLIKKLTKPGGEDIIRQKIQNYLKRVPSQFPECDEEGRKFREQLPDSIIKQLKIYLNQQKNDNSTSPIIIKTEIPKELDVQHECNIMVLLENTKRDDKYKEKVTMFITNEIANIVDKLHLHLTPKRLALLEEELTNTFIEMIDAKSDIDGGKKENIYIILHNLGSLSSYQASYFTDVIMKHFKEDIYDIYVTNEPSHPNTCENTRVNEMVNIKIEKNCIRQFEDIIENWLDAILFKIYGHILHFNDRYQQIHDIAIKIFKILNYNNASNIVMLDSKYLESICLDWFENLPFPIHDDKKKILKNHVNKLVTSLITRTKLDFDENPSKSDIENRINRTGISKVVNKDAHNSKEEMNNNFVIMPNVVVYDITLANTTASNARDINENENDVELQVYSRLLVQQIDEWLTDLKIPQIQDNRIREIVVKDLAEDIIDRHKYLEINPASRGTDERELEELKYQIFKWINKIVEEDEHETVDRASELMDRIRSIPLPKGPSKTYYLPGNKVAKQETSLGCQTGRSEAFISYNENENNRGQVSLPSDSLSNPLSYANGSVGTSNQNNNKEFKSNNNKKTHQSFYTSQLGDDTGTLPPGMTLEEVHEHYNKIFKAHVDKIPLETPNPEQEMLANLARNGTHNGIWKTFFNLKADPDIENDYELFEALFEERIDSILDCLPQTVQMKNLRAAWKSELLFHVMNMLRYVHSITDAPSFREKIVAKYDRLMTQRFYQECSDLQQEIFVANTADAYILYSKYKEEDPIKANVYKQRLMKKIDELINYVKSRNNVGFRQLNQAQLYEMAMKMLESIPVPEDVLREEAEEILVAEEIEQWYNGLSLRPLMNDVEEKIRKRKREQLANKLCELEKGVIKDLESSSVETNVKHEISKYLHDKAAGLLPDQDLRTDFMVDELVNKLKNRKNLTVSYETFKQENPVTSSFIQTDPVEVLAPLVDIGDPKVSNIPEASFQEGRPGLHNSQEAVPSGRSGLHVSQVAGPSGYSGLRSQEAGSDPGYYSANQRNLSQVPLSQKTYVSQPFLNGQVNTSKTADCIAQGYYPVDQEIMSSNQDHDVIKGSRKEYIPGMVRGELEASQIDQIPPIIVPNIAKNAPRSFHPSQDIDKSFRSIGNESQGQVFGRKQLSEPQVPSTGFITGPATRSTARMDTENQDEAEDDIDYEVKMRCRCMERFWKRKRRRYRDDMPPCYPYPLPLPWRFFYY